MVGPQSVWTSTKLVEYREFFSPALSWPGYATNSPGVVTCVNADNGNVLFQERIKGPFSAASVGADDKFTS